MQSEVETCDFGAGGANFAVTYERFGQASCLSTHSLFGFDLPVAIPELVPRFGKPCEGR